MRSDTVTVAWSAVGSPIIIPPTTIGPCARCGTPGDLVPTRKVVSRHFGGWGDWRTPSGPGLCPACVWLYREPLLRTVPHWIHHDPDILTPLSARRLGEQLLRGPVGPDEALTVPLRPGRKHVASAAVWGAVTTDAGPLPWGSQDAVLLRAAHRLRASGFSWRAIAEPQPPWHPLRACPDIAAVMALWAQLEPWRRDRCWMDLAARTAPAVETAS